MIHTPQEPVESPEALGMEARAGRIRRLIVKELREILRDRRTILTLVFMPLLLYPLLTIAFRQLALGAHPSVTAHYRVGVLPAHYPFVFEYLRIAQGPTSGVPPSASDSESAPPQVYIHPIDDLEAALLERRIDVGIRLTDGLPRWRPGDDLAVDWELLVVKGAYAGMQARRWLEESVRASNVRFLEARLRQHRVTQRAVPVTTTPVAIVDPSRDTEFPIRAIVPLILILMTITGAVYPAIDLTAGERERGTLEILVAAPVPRFGLLIAKYAAVVCVAVLTASINLVTMTITISASGLGGQLFGEAGLGWPIMLAVFGLLLLFAAFFSAVLLALTSCARSFKEAQAYLIPLMLASLAPGMLSLMPDLELGGMLPVTPLVNIVLLARDVFEGNADPGAAAIVVITTVLYATAAIAAAARIFGAEGVLFNTQSGWSDLFRRPREVRSIPELATAMYSLVAVFPGYYLLNGLIAQSEAPIAWRLALAGAATAALFGVVPVLFAWFARVRLIDAFSLKRPGLFAWPAAILFGASLWTITHEIVVLEMAMQWVSISPDIVERARASLESWRQASPVLLVLSMAVAPAVCEELYFRGLLLNALGGRMRRAAAVAVSALMFGLFHVVVTDSFAFVRFVPSTLLGVVLATLAVRSASVIPGMLLHATHNAVLVLAAYHEQDLAGTAIGAIDQEHLPVWWLVAAAFSLAVATFLLVNSGPTKARKP